MDCKTEMYNFMIFETHAHYDDEKFEEDRETLLNSLPDNGVGYVVNVGSSIENSKKSIELTSQYKNIYAAVGVHPHEAKELNEEKLEWLREASHMEKVVAIGEIGLDYYYDLSERDIQRRWFQRQIELAKEVKLPLIIHSREAAQETIDIMKAMNVEEIGGVVHCFSYSKEVAKIFADMNFYIGVGGIITFKNARKLVETVEYLPMNKILLETDAPYLAPMPYRGNRNDSTYIRFIAEKIAEIKNISYEEVVRITTENAKNMYRL